MSSENDLLTAALQYAAAGWRVVPVHSPINGRCSCAKPNCKRVGKHPRINSWPEKASCDRSQIFSWWARWPDANVGIATGAGSGIVVLDIDGADGAASLNELAGEDPMILDTRIHTTGSAGTHLLFQHPGFPCANEVRTVPGIDIRGDGGMIVAPPSRHHSGALYAARNDDPIAALPESLFSFFRTADGQGKPPQRFPDTGRHKQCHKERQGATRSIEELRRETKQVVPTPNVPPKNSIDSHQLQWAINSSLPNEQGRRHRQVFHFARHLLTVDGITQETPLTVLKPILRQWHERAEQQAERIGFRIVGDAEESWSDFLFAWQRVKHPVGGLLLCQIFDHVAALDADGQIEPTVWSALCAFDRTEDKDMRILTGALYELSVCHDSEPFSLAVHTGASQLRRIGINRDHKWVYRRLKTMEKERILQCVDVGQSGTKDQRRAASYRWIWTTLIVITPFSLQ